MSARFWRLTLLHLVIMILYLHRIFRATDNYCPHVSDEVLLASFHLDRLDTYFLGRLLLYTP